MAANTKRIPHAEAPAQPTKKQYPHDLLTVAEVARVLRVDGTTVRRWIKQGALEAVILPHMNERSAYRIKRATLNAILATK
jgi:excisionase family DNA binding protein